MITVSKVADTIRLTGNWGDLGDLYALRRIESAIGKKLYWEPPAYVTSESLDPFKPSHYEVIQRIVGNFEIAVFCEYCGNCRSRQSKQPLGKCRTCSGQGYQIFGGRSGGGIPQPFKQRTCPDCGGMGVLSGGEIEPYASGWWNGGWNIRFPEKVLRAYFGEPEVKFNGNFYEALLSSTDINKRYKQLARQYHPDVYQKGSQMFLKLREAYDVLRDPQRRKRYQAGLKFQQLTAQVKNDVVFDVPRKCGDLLVRGQYDGMEHMETVFWCEEHAKQHPPRVLIVSEIINWNDRIREDGCIMTSTWVHEAKATVDGKPFRITWEQPPVEFVINI